MNTLTCHAIASGIELSAAGEPQSEIQWMPPGEHDIVPYVDGKPKRIKQRATPEIAALANTQLQELWRRARAGEGDEPYLDFNHKDEERAGEPMEIFWGGSDPRTGGIRMRVNWTAAGRAAIIARTVRKVSPQWDMDKDTLQFDHISENVGGLVIRSAFKQNAPVMAGAANHNPPQNMELKDITAAVTEALKPIENRLVLLEKKETETATATAAAAKTDDATKAITSAVQAAIKPFSDKLETMETNTRKAQARAALEPHITRGAIAPQDTKAIELWGNTWLADSATAEAQLAKLPGIATGRRLTTASAGAAASAAAGADPEEQFMVKAREAGQKLGLKTDAECVTAFARTTEGAELYNQFRATYAEKPSNN